MDNKIVSLVNRLRAMSSCVDFCPDTLPKDVSLSRVLDALGFLSPIIVILHGSTVSHRKFSPRKTSDLDIICISTKAAFWPLEPLHKRIRENLGNKNAFVDLSIVGYNEFLSILEGKCSLGTSLNHGFSILYYEGKA